MTKRRPEPVRVDRTDRPGWQRCARCRLDWPTANPLPTWACPVCGEVTTFKAKEGS